jgi:hypothetical protein
MAQVIIHSNGNGGVAVTIPTGELSINEVQAKDCPNSSWVVDSSVLPQGADEQFFDAWEIDGYGRVTVNLEKAKDFRLKNFNAAAIQVAQKRHLNDLTGIANGISDADFTNQLKLGRDAIAAAQTTDALALIANPI